MDIGVKIEIGIWNMMTIGIGIETGMGTKLAMDFSIIFWQENKFSFDGKDEKVSAIHSKWQCDIILNYFKSD